MCQFSKLCVLTVSYILANPVFSHQCTGRIDTYWRAVRQLLQQPPKSVFYFIDIQSNKLADIILNCPVHFHFVKKAKHL